VDLNQRLYPRATTEKALLDWIYLGDSPRTKLAPPPLDIDLERVHKRRLKRLAERMKLSKQFAAVREGRERQLFVSKPASKNSQYVGVNRLGPHGPRNSRDRWFHRMK
jgi:hypothetical protein